MVETEKSAKEQQSVIFDIFNMTALFHFYKF